MKKVDLDQLFVHMRACGWEPGALNAASYRLLAGQGFQERTLMLAIVATELLAAGQPMTLRGLFYRVVSAGWLPSTDKGYYEQLKRLLRILRERELVPFEWIVDGVRATIKPSSWSGLQDFADTVRDAYYSPIRMHNVPPFICSIRCMRPSFPVRARAFPLVAPGAEGSRGLLLSRTVTPKCFTPGQIDSLKREEEK